MSQAYEESPAEVDRWLLRCDEVTGRNLLTPRDRLVLRNQIKHQVQSKLNVRDREEECVCLAFANGVVALVTAYDASVRRDVAAKEAL